MKLKTLLRDPVFIDQSTNMTEVSRRLKQEEHAYVFIRNGKNIFPLKSAHVLSTKQISYDEVMASLSNTSPPDTVPFGDLNPRTLDILSEPVTLVACENTVKYILREDFILYIISTGTNNDLAWLHSLFASVPRGLMTVDLNYAVVNSNAEALRMLRIPKTSLPDLRVDKILGLANFEQAYNSQNPIFNHLITTDSNQAGVLVDFVPVVTQQRVTGFVLNLKDPPSIEKMAMELDFVKQLNIDLTAILSSIYDEIIIVDARGRLLRASKHYISSHWSSPPGTFIGQQLLKLKSVDRMLQRVISEVQKKKQKVSMQGDADSPRLYVGNPVFHQSGKLERIVIASRDMTDVAHLQRELEQTRKQSEDYRKELEQMRDRMTKVQGVAPLYASPLMHDVMKEAERVARFSATVLLSGESGVGKEIIAGSIHSLSERREQPFIKINCAAIPESLLESELFGYERGAFSGANQKGKTGLIVKAHNGCLFLDEISELPLIIQGKLLRAIQEREVYPVGATVPIKFDIQIIAATNRPLAELVAQGQFREDLFYRINVFPIEIPPLRERKEDIALLANHFLAKFNQIYQRRLRFSSGAIDILEAYSFPGNVRELQNLIQRMAIKNDAEVIDAMVVERILMQRDTMVSRRLTKFSQVIPLEQAFNQVEEELVTLAMKQYRSTTKAAKALGVSQATVSRKYRKITGKREQQPD